MKRILFALILFSSCSPTHICITKSDSDITKDSVYVYENDTIRITYDFWQPKNQMKLSIYNKLSTPLFIDWKNSSFIVNDNAHPYWQDLTSSQGAYAGDHLTGRSKGVSIHEDRVSFIPSHAKITKTTKGLVIQFKPSPIHKHIRNFIAYSPSEDCHNESFTDNDFEIIAIKKASYTSFSKDRDPRYFYLSH